MWRATSQRHAVREIPYLQKPLYGGEARRGGKIATV